MNHELKLRHALDSLVGLSVGDAFGERFFDSVETTRLLMRQGAFFSDAWRFTDDTLMALSVVEILARYGEVNQDELAVSFAAHYDNTRGYGPSMHRYLADLNGGNSWRVESKALFGGSGSFGNGAAMRVAPLGAYFWTEPAKAVEQARLAAEVTHSHPEGIAGAMAVAAGAASVGMGAVGKAWRDDSDPIYAFNDFLDEVLDLVPDSAVRRGIEKARQLGPSADVKSAAAQLGNGWHVSAQDTVPFCLWCAAVHVNDYEAALWAAVSAGGDRDTNCAIVGGIVAACLHRDEVPVTWRKAREPWPEWFVSVLKRSLDVEALD